jgi:hypothetical protein
MAKYIVAFRLKDGATYDARYSDLIDAINDAGTAFWESGTSLIVMETTLTITALGAKLKAAVNASTDIIFIREIDIKNTAYAGPIGDGFDYFFPDAKKL